MSCGEVTKQDIIFVNESIPVTPSLPKLDDDTIECCFKNVVLADLTDSDEFKNDISAPIHFFAKTMSVNIHLQKWENGGWSDVAALNSGSGLGNFLSQVRQDDLAVGFELKWREVLNTHDTGSYRFRFDYGSGEITSHRYCLEHFTLWRADESVRLTYVRNSTVGDEKQRVRRDFNGLNWKDQVRFKPGRFGYSTGEFSQEELQLNNGLKKVISREFNEKYILEIDLLPIELHQVFKYDICLSDEILISDYNRINKSGDFVEVSVQPTGSYEPNYDADYPFLRMEFEDAFNNKRKLYDTTKF